MNILSEVRVLEIVLLLILVFITFDSNAGSAVGNLTITVNVVRPDLPDKKTTIMEEHNTIINQTDKTIEYYYN